MKTTAISSQLDAALTTELKSATTTSFGQSFYTVLQSPTVASPFRSSRPSLTRLDSLGDVFIVPGTPDQLVQMRFTWFEREASYDNETGVYLLDAQGQVNGIAPNELGYAYAALTSPSRTTLFTSGQNPIVSTEATFKGGDRLGFYIIQDNTTAQWLATNAQNSLNTYAPLAFFSVGGANPDFYDHVRSSILPSGNWQLDWEDLTRGGDEDFNDVVFSIETLNIIDPTPILPQLTIANLSINEGNTGLTPALFNIQLSAASTQAVTVDYATTSGTATAGVDYQTVTGTLSFAPGEVQKTIAVPIIGDRLSEPNETILLTLSSPINATLSNAQGIATILDDDPVVIPPDPSEIILREGNNFHVLADRTLTIPASASVLRFSFADLQFDTTDPNAINDAFEAALVDANGNSLVHTIAKGRDVFFNLTEGQSAALANGATLSGQTVTLNLAGIAPGTAATLILRLVNNDADTTTAVRITDLELVESTVTAPAGVVSQSTRSPSFAFLLATEYAQFSDVSASFAAEYGQTSFNADTEILYTELAVRNAGQYRVNTPLLVAVTRISDPSVRVANAQGITPDGLPYFDFSDLASGQVLEAGTSTTAQTIAFFNPKGVQFDYELVFLGQLTQSQLSNQSPEFTSTPVENAVVGQSYVYVPSASDPNDDPLTYRLLSAPAGITINPNTGRLTWLPTTADVGSQSVILQVDDGAGGLARQSFNIVTQLPASSNYAPVITSSPITIAGLNQSYSYDVDAIDPDGDTLTYSLLSSPQGMAIDPATGLITWNTVNRTPNTYTVSVQATDSFGNASQAQTFALNLFNTPLGEIRGIVWEDLNGNGVRDSDLIQGANPDVVFVADVSLSADDPFIGSPVGDLNGDRRLNTILDAEIAGFIALNQQLIRQGLGQTADVSVISFAATSDTLDMDPVQPGRQVSTKAAADRNNNGILDVDEALRSLRTRSGTNFEAGLRTAETVFTTLGTANGDGNLIFLSDGISNSSGAITDELARLRARGVNISAFGVGQGAALNDGDSVADDLNLIDPDARIFTSTDELLNVFGDSSGGQSVLEPGQANVRVYLDLNRNGVFDPGEPGQLTSNETGEYRFTGLQPGVYQLRQIPPAGYQTTFPERVEKSLIGIDFDGTVYDIDPQTGQARNSRRALTSNTVGITRAPDNSLYTLNTNSGFYRVDPLTGRATVIGATRLNDIFEGDLDFDPTTGVLYGLQYLPGRNARDGGSERFLFTINPATGTATPVGSFGREGDYSAMAFTPNGTLYVLTTVNGKQRLLTVDKSNANILSSVPLSRTIGVVAGMDFDPTTGQLFVADGDNLVYNPDLTTVRINTDTLYSLNPATGVLAPIGLTGAPNGFSGLNLTVNQIPDFYTVNLNSGQTVSDRNFGNTLGGSTTNRPPDFTSTALTNAVAGQPFRYNAIAADPDGDSLTYDLLQAPTGMAIDAQRGVVVWQPASTQVGEQNVVLRVRDGLGGSSVQTFRLIVGENQAPQITSLPIPFARLSTPYQYQVTASDPEGQPIAFSLLSQPEGMTVDPQTGLIQWQPTAGQSGDYRVTVAAQDSQGGLGRQLFTVTAGSNFAPIITSTPTATIAAGQTYRYDLQAIDPDGDPIQFSLAQAPPAITLDALGRLRWNTTGSDVGAYTISLLATDTNGTSTTQTFNLSVQADQQAPLVDLTANQATIERGKTVTFNIASSDNVGVQALNLTLNGNPVAIGTGGITTVQLDDSGLYQVVATAIDAAGNVGTDTLSLRVIDPNDTNAPLIQITSPTTRTNVTSLTNILGSITDTDLESYRVEYAPFSSVDFNNLRLADSDYVTLSTGTTSVQNAVLAQFDPTLLRNDDYVIRVTAQDVNGNVNTQGIVLGVTSNNKLGNFRLEFTDLSIPLGGIPITVERIYDTLQSNQSSDFGFGWSLGAQDARIQESVPTSDLESLVGSLFVASPFQAGTRVYLTNPDGERVGFTFNPVLVGNSFFGPLWKPQFTPDAGVFDTLNDANDGVRVVRASNGSFVFPLFSFAYNPSEYNLTTKAGLTYKYDQFEGLEEIRDRNGNIVTFNDAGITSSTGVSIQFARDAQGRITKVIDPTGKAIQYSYNANGDLIKVTDQAGLSAMHDYLNTRPHYLENIIDARGKTVLQTQYDAQGRVIGTTDALGRSISSTYQLGTDTSTTTQVDPLGNSTITTRDKQGNVISLSDEVNATTLFAYDANNNLVSSTDARGFTTTRSYDSRGNLTRITDPLAQTQLFTYDAFNNVTSETDQLGRVTRLSYDSRGNLIELTNASGQVSRFNYDASGRVTSFTDARNQTTTYSYSSSSGLSLSKPTLITFPDRSPQRVEYDQLGQITRLIDENGHATQYVTDAVGRLVTQRDPLGNETTYTYDAQLITSITDPLGNIARFEYDDAGRLVRQIDPSGGITRFSYDALGRQTTETDPLGRTKTTAYRADGLIASITDAEGNVTTFEYDLTDNQTAVVDPLGQRTAFAYDALGRQIRKTDPLGNSTTYGYDAVDNLIQVIDRNNRRRQFTYDAVDQLTQETWFNGTTPIRTIGFAYDPVGNLIAANDADSTFSFTYNNRDRLTGVTSSSPTSPSTTLAYTYDAAGNRLSVTDNLGASVVSTYDPRNLLTSQTWQGGGIDSVKVEYSYDQRGDRTKTERFADAAGTQLVGRTAYEYDASQRLTDLTHFNGSNAVLADYQYAYDLANQLTRETVNGQTTIYTYDRTNQLTNADRTGQPDEAYTYDSNGNRINNGFVVGANNQVTSDGTFNYGYDNEGNLATKINIATGATTTYSYDYRNRLTAVVDKAANGNTTQTVEFTYDAFDRRISKTVNGQTTYLANDGDQLWAEYNAVGQVIARYLPGADVDEMIARYRPTDETSWYLTDRLGTIRDVVNQLGLLTNQIDYTSFGKLLNQTNPSAGDQFAFTGREYDEETGLYYYRARYYDPNLGQFISQDPLEFASQDANLYRYVGNNPVNATDPSGLIALIEYASITSKIAFGQTGSMLTAAPGFLQGFGSTSLVFIGYILEIANSGGDVIAEWGSAIDKTAAKMEEIKAALEKFSDLDRNGIVGGFVNGAGYELKNKINITVGAKIVGKYFSIGAETSGELTTTITLDLGGGFTKGYEQGLEYLRALQPR